jgi:Predicted permeases
MTMATDTLPKTTSENRIVNGLGLMVLAMLIAPFIDVFSKLATNKASPAMITTARFLFQGLFLLPVVIASGGFRSFSWKQSLYHAIRAALITLSMLCYVATLAVMPVADTLAIFFVEPIMLTVLASLFLKETIGWRRYLACFIGFLGAMIVIRPSFSEVGYITLLPIIAALCVAIFALMTRALSQKEEPWGMQFQMSLWGLLIGTVLITFGGQTEISILVPSLPDAPTIIWMAAVGLAAALSGILSVYAYQRAPAAVLAPMQYLEIVSATLFGWLVFGDFPEPIKWLGISIIIGSGLFIIWRERKFASRPVTEAEKITVTVEP